MNADDNGHRSFRNPRQRQPVTVALDVMGSDSGPEEMIQGAIDALYAFPNIHVICTGQLDRLRPLVRSRGFTHPGLSFEQASQVVGMHEAATDSLQKNDSSVAVAARLVKDKRADGMVSPGNTGATMATALKQWRRLPGIARPAIAAVLPHPKRPSILLDVGANVDCKPHWLQHFALMGSVYSHALFHRRNPRVGLLTIGEEECKGNAVVLEAHQLLKRAPINFVGNAEGRDIMKGTFDVIVCDGFVGNIVLKSAEGFAEFVLTNLKEEVMASGPVALLGGLAMKPALNSFKRRVDHTEYGGAPLLGLNGTCVICHGSSRAKAIMNAIRVAAELVAAKVNDQIADLLSRQAEAGKEQLAFASPGAAEKIPSTL